MLRDVARMTPAVDEIALVGTVRLTLKPLLDKVPCIGAVTVSLLKPPVLNFHIDVGKALGGNAMGNTVKQALRRFIKDTLIDFLIWPNRCVVPIMVRIQMHFGFMPQYFCTIYVAYQWLDANSTREIFWLDGHVHEV